jgi:NADH:ubiquinone oxidoreductase subunit 3 (subunit A)
MLDPDWPVPVVPEAPVLCAVAAVTSVMAAISIVGLIMNPLLREDQNRSRRKRSQNRVFETGGTRSVRRWLCLRNRGVARMYLILIVVLVLLLIGGLPTWPYSTDWGYYPSSGIGLLLVILFIVLLLRRR